MKIKFFKSTDKDHFFWDFDGVIKNSLEAKAFAFEKLFLEFGKRFSLRVRKHHEENLGVSRFKKISLYLDWLNKDNSESEIFKYSKKYSEIVKQSVIESPWVVGAEEILGDLSKSKNFYMVSSTPENELKEILESLGIKKYFLKIIGSPIEKSFAIKSIIKTYSINKNRSVFIGDTIIDYKAAKQNGIEFILVKNKFNVNLQHKLNCSMINNYYE